MILKRASAAVSTAVLLGGLATAATTALPAAASATAACTMTVGSITSGGDIADTKITAGAPITASRTAGPHIFTPGIARMSSSWTTTLTASGGDKDRTSGQVVLNSALYSAWYGHDAAGKPFTGLSNGSKGWQGYIDMDTSTYYGDETFGLRQDGVMYRWSNPYGATIRYTGFSAVKTMTLISQTRTYDTFLANARGGALYTIRIPVDGAQKPVVKKIRTSTWQNFDSLVAQKCGTQSTLLTAIDKETGSAYLYAVGHANGESTVIQGLGKIPGSFTDPVYYLHNAKTDPQLYGE